MDELTQQEQQTLIQLLSKVEPGFYPIELFWQFARLSTLATFEVVPLFETAKGVSVVLYPRSKNDKHWPNKLHIPGCVVRPTDTEADTLQRILHEEMAGATVSVPRFLTTQVRQTLRGHELAVIYISKITSVPDNAEAYPVDKLPASLLPAYPDIIKDAVKLYTSTRQQVPNNS